MELNLDILQNLDFVNDIDLNPNTPQNLDLVNENDIKPENPNKPEKILWFR